MLTLEAFDADISPESIYLPLIAAAGMLLLETDHIAQPDIDTHLSGPR